MRLFLTQPVGILLLFVFFCMPLSTPTVHAAEPVVVVGGEGAVAEIVNAAANEVSQAILASLEIKEFVLDDIAFALAKAALQELTGGIVDWINSGFQGDPAFVTDLEQYLLDTADQVAGEIIYGTDLGFLCSPLELDVRLALEISYEKSKDLGYAVQCTVSDVVSNVEDFYSGNFLAGGWPGWFEVVTKPQNNIFGATAIAQARLQNDILAAQNRELEILEWGEGFLSWESCKEVGPKKIKKCTIETPGQVISEQLTFTLSTGQRTLIEADEINEIIGALFAQIGQQALSGVGGLLGLSSSGSDGSPSYTQQIGNPAYDSTIGQGGGAGQAVSFISGAIADEREYRRIVQRAIDRATSVAAQANQAGSCGQNRSIASRAESIRAEWNAEFTESLNTEALLQGMQFRYDAASNEERLLIVEEFESLRTSGALHTHITNVRVGFDVDDVIETINSMAAEIEDCPGSGTNTGGSVNDR